MIDNGQKQIAGAIIVAGVLIAGAMLLKGSAPATQPATTAQGAAQAIEQQNDIVSNPSNIVLDPVTSADHILGDPNASVSFVEYADYQCPFCGEFFAQTEPTIVSDYVNTGKINFVYRNYPFLGPESTTAAEAAECAADQGQFWQYHDYLFSHQKGENQGAFTATNLEGFAKTLGLNTTTFNSCLEGDDHADAIAKSVADGTKAGVTGTPKGFIVKDGKVLSTMDGAESLSTVEAKLDAALK